VAGLPRAGPLALVAVVLALLHFAPVVVLAALLLTRRYVGEAKIVALRERARPRPHGRRRVRQRWPPAAERAPRALLLRCTRVVRGPPAAFRAAAV
jgi:hypothetical protein